MAKEMSDRDRLFLWAQMASPIHQEREAAARELGDLFLPGRDVKQVHTELIEWLLRQRAESRCAEALLVLVWAQLRDPESTLPEFESLTKAICFPSLLAAELLELLYGRRPAWNVLNLFDDTVRAAEDLDRARFERIHASVAGYLGWPRLAHAWRSGFPDVLRREFGVVDRRLKRPSIEKMRDAQHRSTFIPNYQTLAIEAYVSGFQRAVAAMAATEPVADQYAWYTCPVAPAWWLAPAKSPDDVLVELLGAADLEETVGALNAMRDHEMVPGRLHARVHESENRIVDLQVVAFYQRVARKGVPYPTEICEAFAQPQLTLSGTALPAPLPAQTPTEWRAHVHGWDIVPSTLAVSTDPVAVWHADVCLREPALPFAGSELNIAVDHERTLMRCSVGGKTISTSQYWIVSPEVKRCAGTLARIGAVTLLSTAFLKKNAASIRSVSAFAIRRLVYEREHSYDDYVLAVEEAFVGTTSILLP
jgi:hypothetical protein